MPAPPKLTAHNHWQRWKNEHGSIHRDDGAAVIFAESDGPGMRMIWYELGKLCRVAFAPDKVIHYGDKYVKWNPPKRSNRIALSA